MKEIKVKYSLSESYREGDKKQFKTLEPDDNRYTLEYF